MENNKNIETSKSKSLTKVRRNRKMTLVKWSPWREIATANNYFDRFFDNAFLRSGFDSDDLKLTRWHPMVDVYDWDGEIVIKAELPGMEKKDIAVDVKDRVLTLKGERSYDNEVKDDNYYRRERVFGKFERSFSLPDGLDTEKIKADYKDGLLSVEIPKPEKQKPKKITIH
jgi:HSP20 family protein